MHIKFNGKPIEVNEGDQLTTRMQSIDVFDRSNTMEVVLLKNGVRIL